MLQIYGADEVDGCGVAMPDDWSPFNDGATLGQAGSEGGIILRDEEHLLGARITLKQGGRIAPFSITCGVYGLLMHTRFFGAPADGEREYDAMKPGLVDVAEAGGKDFNAAASAFITQYP